MKIHKCPYCGGKAKVSPFISHIKTIKPIKLFGKWTLIKERYREVPAFYIVECSKFCDGFADAEDFYIGTTVTNAVRKWNKMCDEKDCMR